MQRTNICTNVLQRFARFTKALRWIAAGYLCVLQPWDCCNVFTCTIIAPLVSFNLPCFATIIIILSSILNISVSDHNRFLHSTMSTEERRKLSVWIPLLTLPIVCNMEHMIARTPHTQLHGHTFNRPITLSLEILSHYFTKLPFIVQESNADTSYIARSNVFASHNVRFRARKFRSKNTFFTSDYFGNSLRYKSKFVDGTDTFSLLLVHRLWKGL